MVLGIKYRFDTHKNCASLSLGNTACPIPSERHSLNPMTWLIQEDYAPLSGSAPLTQLLTQLSSWVCVQEGCHTQSCHTHCPCSLTSGLEVQRPNMTSRGICCYAGSPHPLISMGSQPMHSNIVERGPLFSSTEHLLIY